MTRTYWHLEFIVLLIPAVALGFLAWTGYEMQAFQPLFGHALLAKRIPILRLIMAVFALQFFAASMSSLLLVRKRSCSLSGSAWRFLVTTLEETMEDAAAVRKLFSSRGDAVLLAVMVAIAAIIRLYLLDEPVRYDEAFTYLEFARGPVQNLFFYPLPNNHVLHTLLVRVSLVLFGDSLVALRLPALLAGILSVLMVFVASRLVGRHRLAGFGAAALLAVYPAAVFYGAMARGYSLVMLFSLCCIVQGCYVIQKNTPQRAFLLSLSMALGLYVVPSFLYPAAGVGLWILVMLLVAKKPVGQIVRHFLVPLLLGGFIFTLWFYTPVVLASNGWQTVADNDFTRNMPYSGFFDVLPSRLLRVGHYLMLGWPGWMVVMLVALLVTGLGKASRERNWMAFSLLPCLLGASAVILFLKPVFPASRVWLFLTPAMVMLMDGGLCALANQRPGLYKLMLPLVLIPLALFMGRDRIPMRFVDGGLFPEAKEVAVYLEPLLKSGDQVVALAPADFPLKYYMDERLHGAIRPGFSPSNSTGRTYFVQPDSKPGDPSRYGARLVRAFHTAKLYELDAPGNK